MKEAYVVLGCDQNKVFETHMMAIHYSTDFPTCDTHEEGIRDNNDINIEDKHVGKALIFYPRLCSKTKNYALSVMLTP
jgi:hypothetical protein